jgi:hypothetical protein
VRQYRRKSCPSSVGTGDDGARGCRFPSWRRRQGVSTLPSLSVWFGKCLQRKPRFGMDQRDCSVLDIVTLLRASILETLLGGNMSHSSGACRRPRLSLRVAMHTVVGESKTMLSSGLTKSCHSLATSFSTSRVDGASTRKVLQR